MFVPMPDGSLEEIKHASVDTAKKTLGVMACLSCKSSGSIGRMQEKAKD